MDDVTTASVRTRERGRGGAAHVFMTLLQENDLLQFASGLTDPDLSLAASIHLFAWAGVNVPAALNGPQYIARRMCS